MGSDLKNLHRLEKIYQAKALLSLSVQYCRDVRGISGGLLIGLSNNETVVRLIVFFQSVHALQLHRKCSLPIRKKHSSLAYARVNRRKKIYQNWFIITTEVLEFTACLVLTLHSWDMEEQPRTSEPSTCTAKPAR